MLENLKTETQGVHYSRYIMSWLNAGGRVHDFGDEQFQKWLIANQVTDDEIQRIKEMCVGAGKLELEMSAKPYIKAQNEYYKELVKELEEEEKKKKESSIDILRKKIQATPKAFKKAFKNAGKEAGWW